MPPTADERCEPRAPGSLELAGRRTDRAGPRARRNLVDRRAENFKPPLFAPNDSVAQRLGNRLRRFVDLQAGSAWRDLAVELSTAKGSLLDVGCGAQVFRPLVPPAVVYTGIDTKDAKTRFGYEIPDTFYFEGDDWGIPAASYDNVLCTEVLEHVQHPAPFLAQTARVLRPGGRLVMTVPFAARWHFIPYDYWRYTPSSLAALLGEAGFEDIRVTARGTPLTVACYKAMALPLMLLFAPPGRLRFVRRGLGLLLAPLALVLAGIGTMSLRGDWGDDCLGYTITARRSA